MNLGQSSDGRPVVFDEETGAFRIGGASVSAAVLRGYDQNGLVSWVSEDVRAWLYEYVAAIASPQVAPAHSQVASAQYNEGVAATHLRCPNCGAFKTTRTSPIRWLGAGVAGLGVIPGFMLLMMMNTYTADRAAAYQNGYQFNSGVPWYWAGCTGLFILIGIVVFAVGSVSGSPRCAVCGFRLPRT